MCARGARARGCVARRARNSRSRHVLGAVVLGERGSPQRHDRGAEREQRRQRLLRERGQVRPADGLDGDHASGHCTENARALDRGFASGRRRCTSGRRAKISPIAPGFAGEAILHVRRAHGLQAGGDLQLAIVVRTLERPMARPYTSTLRWLAPSHPGGLTAVGSPAQRSYDVSEKADAELEDSRRRCARPRSGSGARRSSGYRAHREEEGEAVGRPSRGFPEKVTVREARRDCRERLASGSTLPMKASIASQRGVSSGERVPPTASIHSSS